jgi:hypothetical protein
MREARRLLPGDLLAPPDEARTLAAGHHLGLEGGERRASVATGVWVSAAAVAAAAGAWVSALVATAAPLSASPVSARIDAAQISEPRSDTSA